MNQTQKLLPSASLDYHALAEFNRQLRPMYFPRHKIRPHGRFALKGTWEEFLLVWMTGHQCHKQGREDKKPKTQQMGLCGLADGLEKAMKRQEPKSCPHNESLPNTAFILDRCSEPCDHSPSPNGRVAAF